MNKVIIVGNLTRDVELRYTPSGSTIGTFGIAETRKWKDKNTNEMREEVLFVDVSVFGKSAEIANQYLSKGKKVLVEGRLKLDQWQDQQGNNRSKHTIVCENYEFLTPKGDSQSNNGQANYQQPQNTSNYNGVPTETYAPPPQDGSRTPPFEIDDSSIPF